MDEEILLATPAPFPLFNSQAMGEMEKRSPSQDPVAGWPQRDIIDNYWSTSFDNLLQHSFGYRENS